MTATWRILHEADAREWIPSLNVPYSGFNTNLAREKNL